MTTNSDFVKSCDLHQINLSLSSKCNANCIFCPEVRGKGLKVNMMTPKLVEKIAKNVSDDPNLRLVKHFSVSEIGEPFMNPQAIECLRILKGILLDCTISVFTNFSLFTEDKITVALQEGLIDHLSCNIDGHDEYHYRAVKGIDFERTKRNILSFLRIRNELDAKVPLTIYSIPYAHYVAAIKNNFGFIPSRLRGIDTIQTRDDFALIKRYWKPLLNSQNDRIIHLATVGGWAERPEFADLTVDYRKYTCPRLDRIRHEANIAPDGTWYACCNDVNLERIIGNVDDDTLGNLSTSVERRRIISALENRKFEEVGGPCKTIMCCQRLHRSKLLTSLMPTIFSHPRAVNMIMRLKEI